MKINEFGKMHIPMKFTWEMTEKCNLNCKMCYSRDCNSDGKKELSTKQSIYLLNKLEKENVLYMFLDGGEPLLRPDFFELLPLITSRFCTWLSTNGTLIDMSVAKQIKKSHLNTVFVSLHGSNEKLHDFITGTEGAYNKTINGIDALKKEKVNTMLSCQVSRENIDDVEEYIKLCKFYSIKKINFLRPYPLGNGKQNYEKMALSASEYEWFTREIANLCSKYDMNYGHSFGTQNHNCCKQAFSCDSEGKLMNCPYLRFLPRLGNILTDNLVSVWNSLECMKVREYAENNIEKCAACVNVCECQGGCTADRILGNGKDRICGRENIKYMRNSYVKSGYPRVDLELDIKMFLYNTRTGKEYALNSLSTLVWEMLDVPKTEDEICNFFGKAGIADSSKALFEVKKICNLLLELDIISVNYE